MCVCVCVCVVKYFCTVPNKKFLISVRERMYI